MNMKSLDFHYVSHNLTCESYETIPLFHAPFFPKLEKTLLIFRFHSYMLIIFDRIRSLSRFSWQRAQLSKQKIKEIIIMKRIIIVTSVILK